MALFKEQIVFFDSACLYLLSVFALLSVFLNSLWGDGIVQGFG